MRNLSKYFLLLAIFILCLFNTFASTSFADVVISDQVTTLGTPVRLVVLTKGKLFPQGGQLVDIYIDNEKLKQILTGGDGYGYLNYIPKHPGLKRITARSGIEKSSGLILTLEKHEKVVLIELEGGFKDSLLSDKTKADSRGVIEALSNKFKIIYLRRYRYISNALSKKWLEMENFPESVVITWKGIRTLEALKEKGLNLHAIIGSTALISASVEFIENRYSFEKTKDGKTVADWKEIEKLLNTLAP